MSTALREKRREVYKEIRRLADLSNDPKHEWIAQEEESWEKVNAEFDALGEKIERAERLSAIEKSMGEGDLDLRIGRQDQDGRISIEPRDDDAGEGDPDDASTSKSLAPRDPKLEAYALQAWMRYGSGLDLSREHRQACRALGINPAARHFDIPLRRDKSYREIQREFRAMSTALTAGGDTIPQGFVNAFERALLFFGGMRQVGEILRTATGNKIIWPMADDTGQVGELLAENAAAALQDVVTSQLALDAYKYSSKLVKVSVELLEDSAFDLASILGEMLGERIGRITNTHFTTGTGTAQPKGIITAGSLYTAATGNTTIKPDLLFDLVHKVDPAYRTPQATWMMHDDSVLKIRKLKDTTNQYLFQAGLQLGVPDTLLGYRLVLNNDVATEAASAKVAAFGALNLYKIRDVSAIRIRRLVERFADNDQEGFIVFSRHDGDLLNAGTNPVKILQLSAT